VTLTRQDWRGASAGWAKDSLGSWEIEVVAPGAYDITLRAPAAEVVRNARMMIGEVERGENWPAGQDRITFERVMLPAARAKVEASVERDGKRVGVHYVDLFARDAPKGQ
jgi:hypothetical protein